ncbi:MAG: ligand-gated channel, partial [Alphaproteobacteria bacterium]|nr:ligand-gated channel [Alphaproteobacteria bacterium]
MQGRKQFMNNEKIRSRRSTSIVALAVGICGGLSGQPLLAQEEAASDDFSFDEIVVVGSRRKDRTAADSNVPVDVLGGADLAASGQTETNMLLNSLL